MIRSRLAFLALVAAAPLLNAAADTGVRIPVIVSEPARACTSGERWNQENWNDGARLAPPGVIDPIPVTAPGRCIRLEPGTRVSYTGSRCGKNLIEVEIHSELWCMSLAQIEPPK